MSNRLLLLMLISILAGCEAPMKQPIRHCEGKKTAAEAISALNSHSEKAVPVRASGRCLLRYYLEGKQHKENFPVKLWVNPPDEIYLQGDVAFDATGLVLGSNAEEFWLWLKPKEISTYWWGNWSQAGAWGRLALNSRVLLEAFGTVDFHNGNRSLTRIGNYDVLVLHGEQDTVLKMVYIEPCDYVVSKIEYLDSQRCLCRAEFNDYETIDEGYLAPTSIKIIDTADDEGENSASISLSSVKPVQFNEQQRQRLFVRPRPRGFEHVYEIIDGTAVEQKTE